jgi:hypothetical protein
MRAERHAQCPHEWRLRAHHEFGAVACVCTNLNHHLMMRVQRSPAQYRSLGLTCPWGPNRVLVIWKAIGGALHYFCSWGQSPRPSSAQAIKSPAYESRHRQMFDIWAQSVIRHHAWTDINQLIAGLGLCLGCWLSRLRFALFWFLPELWRVEKCFASLRCLFPAFSRKWFGAWFFKRNLLQLRRVQYAVRLWSGSKKSLGPWDQKNSANLSNMSVHLCRYNSGVFRCKKKLEFWYCSTFVCIWQLVSNHELISLKRFVSWFTTKLCN